MKTNVTIEMDATDFDHLWTTSMNWAGTDWATQDGRFDPMPDYNKFQRAYWFESYSDLVMARSYLQTIGQASSTHFDDGEWAKWLLLTDFGGKLHD
jgi:hypothetical protein